MKFVLFISLMAFSLFSLTTCSSKSGNSLQLSGSTMGTSYHITIVDRDNKINTTELQTEIDAHLVEINQQMSTYIKSSEISQFNRHSELSWFPVSNKFLRVVITAAKAYKISSGAFDPTIYPLVDLWGFAKEIKVSPPTETEIQTTLKNTGFQHLKIQQFPPALSKNIAPLSLDLSAIAKGYGVDAIAKFLNNRGLTDYLVEIGGEIHASGHNVNNEPWRIAIEQPDDKNIMPSSKAVLALSLSNQSVATSGNYRNYYTFDGKRYAHTLDPKTGKTVENTLASVTVIHPSAMWADAMATSIMVMGMKAGLAFANKEKLAVFMVIHDDDAYTTLANEYFLIQQDLP